MPLHDPGRALPLPAVIAPALAQSPPQLLTTRPSRSARYGAARIAAEADVRRAGSLVLATGRV